MIVKEDPGTGAAGHARTVPGALDHAIIKRRTYDVLRAPATIQMYAYTDGTRTVCVGVYFAYVLFDNRRQISVPILYGILENAHDVLRIHGPAAGCAAAYDILQLTLAHPESVYFILKLWDLHSVQNCLESIVNLCVDTGQLRPLSA